MTTTGSQNTTDTYVYRRDGTPLELIRTQSGVTSTYWYEVDGRGDVIALTDATGNTVDRYTYDLWGKLVSSSDPVPQRLRYAGAWYDQELGWYWMTHAGLRPGAGAVPPAGSEPAGRHLHLRLQHEQSRSTTRTRAACSPAGSTCWTASAHLPLAPSRQARWRPKPRARSRLRS